MDADASAASTTSSSATSINSPTSSSVIVPPSTVAASSQASSSSNNTQPLPTVKSADDIAIPCDTVDIGNNLEPLDEVGDVKILKPEPPDKVVDSSETVKSLKKGLQIPDAKKNISVDSPSPVEGDSDNKSDSPLTPSAILTADDNNLFIIKNAAPVITRTPTSLKPHSMPFKMTFSASVLMGDTVEQDKEQPEKPLQDTPSSCPASTTATASVITTASSTSIKNTFTAVEVPSLPTPISPVKCPLPTPSPMTPQRPQGPSDLYRSSPQSNTNSQAPPQAPPNHPNEGDSLTFASNPQHTSGSRFTGLDNATQRSTSQPHPSEALTPPLPRPQTSHTVLRPTPQHPNMHNAYRFDSHPSPSHPRLPNPVNRNLDDIHSDRHHSFPFTSQQFINSDPALANQEHPRSFIRKRNRDGVEVAATSDSVEKHPSHLQSVVEDCNRLHYTELRPVSMQSKTNTAHQQMYSMNQTRVPVDAPSLHHESSPAQVPPPHLPLHLINPANQVPLHSNPSLHSPHFSAPQQQSPNSHQPSSRIVGPPQQQNSHNSYQPLHRNFQTESTGPLRPALSSSHPHQPHLNQQQQHRHTHQNSTQNHLPQHMVQAKPRLFTSPSPSSSLPPSSSSFPYHPRLSINNTHNHGPDTSAVIAATSNQYPSSSSYSSDSGTIPVSKHSKCSTLPDNNSQAFDSSYGLLQYSLFYLLFKLT